MRQPPPLKQFYIFLLLNLWLLNTPFTTLPTPLCSYSPLRFIPHSFIPQIFYSEAKAASREPVRARHGIVASTSRLASQVGVNIMRSGGNAVDAAIAVAFTLSVTYPAAGNLGGGGFMMVRSHNGKTTAIDYRETAPLAATRNIYLNPKGEVIEGEGSSTIGYRAVGVPGTVAGMALAFHKYGSGKITWSRVCVLSHILGCLICLPWILHHLKTLYNSG